MPNERLQLLNLCARKPLALQSRCLRVARRHHDVAHLDAADKRLETPATLRDKTSGRSSATPLLDLHELARNRPRNVLARPNGKLFRPDSPLFSVSASAAFGRTNYAEDTRLPRIAGDPEKRIREFTAVVRREVLRHPEPRQIRLDMLQLAHEWGIFVYRAEMIVARAIAQARREGQNRLTAGLRTADSRPFAEAGRTLHPIPKRDRLPWRFMALTATVVMLEAMILWYLSR